MNDTSFLNDSRFTVVGSPSQDLASQTFVTFTHDSMTNTTIVSPDRQILYTVESDKLTNSQTKIYKRNSKELVAEIRRKNILPDHIKFGDKPSVKLSSWLSGANHKWSDFPVSFEWEYTVYTWKRMDRIIGLYPSYSPESPVAWFRSSRTETVDGVSSFVRAQVTLKSQAVGILDGIIVSLLVVENRLRLFGAKRGADNAFVEKKGSLI